MIYQQGTKFQFGNTGSNPLCFLIVTIPPWSRPEETTYVRGFWNRDQGNN